MTPSLTFKRTSKPGVYRVADRFTVWCDSYAIRGGGYAPSWRLIDERTVHHCGAAYRAMRIDPRWLAGQETTNRERLVDGLIEAVQEMERWYRREPSEHQRAQHKWLEGQVKALREQVLNAMKGDA